MEFIDYTEEKHRKVNGVRRGRRKNMVGISTELLSVLKQANAPH